jgi:hypothetical protein
MRGDIRFPEEAVRSFHSSAQGIFWVRKRTASPLHLRYVLLMATRHRFFTIYGCDRAGVPWDEVTMMDPKAILDRLDALRKARPDRVYGVYDKDNEETGDREQELEELAFESE